MAKRSDDEGYRTFSRRTVLVGGMQLIGLGVLGGRLAYLQVVEGNRYKVLSDKNRINVRLISPPRGLIVDRFGVPLAVNVENFQVHIIREQTQDMQASLLALQKLIPLDNQTIGSVIEQSRRVPKFVPVKVKEELTWEEVAKIEVNLPDLPGLLIDKGETRNYPYGIETSHLTGYVGAVSEEVLKAEGGKEPVLSLPGFKIGKNGVERQYDREMRGKAGAVEIEVNVVGREVRELKRKEATPGDRITLTIDAELQRFAHELLTHERSASAVVMDAHTGAVYVMASHPGYDPNLFSRGIPYNIWKSLLEDSALPLSYKALVGQYPPGSTFKMITGLAGLESGVTNPQRTVYCPGFYMMGKQKFHCWRPQGHGHVNLTAAIQKSCDTYFYTIANEMGIDKIAEVARRFGLGSKLGFNLEDERPGIIPDKNWKYARFGERWHNGETVVNAIGQGYVLATPLQLAVMTARLVNGGYAVKPWITEKIGELDQTPQEAPKMTEVKDEYLRQILKGMESVVNTQGGTAYGSRIAEPGMEMGGKTGTAQVQRITKEQRALGIKNENLPWEQRHHALFVGYAPIESPRYVCSVVVEHGIGGSRTAAPIAKELLLKAQLRDPSSMTVRLDEEPVTHSMEGIVFPDRKPGHGTETGEGPG
ncbi:MAG: penicillin-binding protein 2 [Alphaproteobacteria bacterium]|nr:penicillin-binding protein 2 [Alphaproteobacteria bacterium]